MMMMNMKRKSKGFTLIEVLIVLAVAAGVLFTVFLAVNKVQAKQLTKEAAEGLNLMVADTRAKFKSQGNFTGVSAQVLVNNRVPPSNMIQGANIVSQWSSNIEVAPATLQNTNDAVSFTYTGIGIEDCSNFVQAAEATFSRITVGTTVVKNIPSGSGLNVAALGTACVGGGGRNTITFVQGR